MLLTCVMALHLPPSSVGRTATAVRPTAAVSSTGMLSLFACIHTPFAADLSICQPGKVVDSRQVHLELLLGTQALFTTRNGIAFFSYLFCANGCHWCNHIAFALDLGLTGAGRVQVSLIAEGVLWKRGILVMPPIVHKMVQAMQVSSLPMWAHSCCALSL